MTDRSPYDDLQGLYLFRELDRLARSGVMFVEDGEESFSLLFDTNSTRGRRKLFLDILQAFLA